MQQLASQINSLFEIFKKTQNRNPLQTHIVKLLHEFESCIKEIPQRREAKISATILSVFLSRFGEANEKGKYQRSIDPPNLVFWNALGFGKDEVTNCRILCWLLDPSADHCQGNRFFACLLQHKSLKKYSDYAKQSIYVRREEWLDETNRADIIIHGKEFNVVIEAKIRANERQYQRVDYCAKMLKSYPGKEFIGVFLVPENSYSEENYWISITWKDILDAIRLFTSTENINCCNNSFVRELSSQYGKYIENIIC